MIYQMIRELVDRQILISTLFKIIYIIKNYKKKIVDIMMIRFKDFFGRPTPISIVYKLLKSLLNKRLIKNTQVQKDLHYNQYDLNENSSNLSIIFI